VAWCKVLEVSLIAVAISYGSRPATLRGSDYTGRFGNIVERIDETPTVRRYDPKP
jgi:hypothetical protein